MSKNDNDTHQYLVINSGEWWTCEEVFDADLYDMVIPLSNISRSANGARVGELEEDAKRMRWMLSGNGYFMEEQGLCGHGPCGEEEQNKARAEIDTAMRYLTPPATGTEEK